MNVSTNGGRPGMVDGGHDGLPEERIMDALKGRRTTRRI